MDTYKTVLDVIDSHQDFALSTHVNPDGDAIGSELALYSFLKDLGKHVRIFNTDAVPEIYQFLPFCDAVLPLSALKDYSPEILVVLDSGMLKRIGDDLSRFLIPTKAIVNIDHHATANHFGSYNLIEVEASSTCEIVYQLIRQHGTPIGRDRALCLYTGIMFDTGCFRYANSTPAAHQIAAELINAGVSVDEVYRLVYETIPAARLRLLGKVLQTLGITPDGKIAWVYATQEMFSETGTGREEVDGFINHIRSIDTVEFALLVSEQEDGKSKASLRSKSYIDVGEIAAEFGGGGHQRAAGCEINAHYGVALAKLVASAQRRINKLTQVLGVRSEESSASLN